MKIGDYKQMMAYLTRPEQPKEQFASAEVDALKEELNEKLGPGVIKTLDELPPVQNPFKDFEDRNPRENAAEGGRINFGIGGGGKAYLEKEKKLIKFFQDKIDKGQIKIDKDLSGFVKESKLDFNNTQFLRVLNRNFPNTFVYKGIQYKNLPQDIQNKIIDLSKTKAPAEIAKELNLELPTSTSNSTSARSVRNFLIENKIKPIEQIGGSSIPMEERLLKENVIKDFIEKNPDVTTANSIAKNINLQNPDFNMSDSFVETTFKRLGLEDLLKTRHAEIFPQIEKLDKILKQNKKLLTSNLSDEAKKNELLKIYAKETNQSLDQAASNFKTRLSKLGKLYAGEDQRYETKLYNKIKIPAGYMDSNFHKNIVAITNRAGKVSNYDMAKLLGLPKKELDLIQGTSNMMNAFDFKVAGDHTDIKALMKDFGNYKKNFSRIEYIKDNLNEFKRGYDRKILSLARDAKNASPLVQQDLLNKQKMLQDEFAELTGYRIGGFDVEKGRVTVKPQTMRLPDLKNPYNETLQKAMENFQKTGVPGKKKTTFNKIDQRLINSTPEERIKIFEEIAGTDVAKQSKYLKALQKIPKIGKIATAVISGTAGAAAFSTLANASEGPEASSLLSPELTTAAGAGTGFALRKPLTKFGKYALQVAGTPLGATGLIAGFGIDPKNAMDRVGIEAELALAPELVKQTSKLVKNPLLQRILNLGLSPTAAARAARIASPIGIASLGGEALYKYGKFVKDELDRIEKMSPEEREAYNIAEQEQMGVAAADGGLIRQGFADGPPDPSKRKFFKTMAGLASLPIFGKFLKPATKAIEAGAPVAEKAVTEAEKIFFNLVDAVKSKGIMDKLDRVTGGRLSGAYHEYKGAEVLEDAGSITARFKTDKGAPAEIVYIKPQKRIDPKTGKEVEYPGQFDYEAQEIGRINPEGDVDIDAEFEIIDSLEDVKKLIDD